MTLNPWNNRGQMTAYENDPESGGEKYNTEMIQDAGYDPELFKVLCMIDAKLCDTVTVRHSGTDTREYIYVWLEEFNELYNLGAPLVYLGLNGLVLKVDQDGMDYVKQYFCVVDAVVEAWNAGHSFAVAKEMVEAASAEYYGG